MPRKREETGNAKYLLWEVHRRTEIKKRQKLYVLTGQGEALGLVLGKTEEKSATGD